MLNKFLLILKCIQATLFFYTKVCRYFSPRREFMTLQARKGVKKLLEVIFYQDTVQWDPW